MNTKTSMGMNRTGMAMSPDHADALLEVPGMTVPTSSGSAETLDDIRLTYYDAGDGLGSVPPPATLKGMVGTAIEAAKGHRAVTLIDQLGARLAFERGGVRLYEAFISKLGAADPESSHVLPPLDGAIKICEDELRHARLIGECLESLGADPTALTPCGNLTGVMNAGLMQAMTDPRTSITQCLNVLLAAEVADQEGWAALIQLTRESGQDDWTRAFEDAMQSEEEHAVTVRQWYLEALGSDSRLLGRTARGLDTMALPTTRPSH